MALLSAGKMVGLRVDMTAEQLEVILAWPLADLKAEMLAISMVDRMADMKAEKKVSSTAALTDVTMAAASVHEKVDTKVVRWIAMMVVRRDDATAFPVVVVRVALIAFPLVEWKIELTAEDSVFSTVETMELMLVDSWVDKLEAQQVVAMGGLLA